MLYEVLLHELGHLQVVDETAATERRKFACETCAQEFAEEWCRKLWSEPFDHPDPVHHPPSPEEIKKVRDGWQAAHSDYKKGLLCEKRGRYEEAVSMLSRAVERYPGHELALERLGYLPGISIQPRVRVSLSVRAIMIPSQSSDAAQTTAMKRWLYLRCMK